ncbi:hypothetical protein NIES2109_58740 (plasmid) [Nostoc sp. HK-01]|nr:hypothetical protein NIES2109_58740 [Nostoc sp. HK-01]
MILLARLLDVMFLAHLTEIRQLLSFWFIDTEFPG